MADTSPLTSTESLDSVAYFDTLIETDNEIELHAQIISLVVRIFKRWHLKLTTISRCTDGLTNKRILFLRVFNHASLQDMPSKGDGTSACLRQEHRHIHQSNR